MYRQLEIFFTSLMLAAAMAGMVLMPAVSMAQSPPIPGFYGRVSGMEARINNLPADRLPQLNEIVSGISGISTSGARMDVNQNESKAVIKWDEFNIGEDAYVKFNQDSTDWVAVNKILDANPSLVLGKLEADGKIYLINANGILFGKDSRINVHSLIASTLGIDEDLVDGINFTTIDADADSAITNLGDITAKAGGAVILVAPTVENGGTIDATQGKIFLLGGTRAVVENGDVKTIITDERDIGGKVVKPTVYNMREGEWVGKLYADEGLVRMIGRTVNQDGVIRSVSSVENQGKIQLVGTDKVRIGAESEIVVNPEPYDSDKNFSDFQAGEVDIRSRYQTDPGNTSEDPTSDNYKNDLDHEIGITTSDDAENQLDGSIEIAGRVAAESGVIKAKAGKDVTVKGGSELDVSAADYAAAGNVELVSKQGSVGAESGSSINISGRDLSDGYDYFDAAKLGVEEREAFIENYADLPDLDGVKNSLNAGSLKVSAENGDISLDGDINARGGDALIRIWKPSDFVIAEGATTEVGGLQWAYVEKGSYRGTGGGVDYTAGGINDLGALHDKLTASGFDQYFRYTATLDDLSVDRNVQMFGTEISIAAEQGNLEFKGTAVAPDINLFGHTLDFEGYLWATRSQFQEASIDLGSTKELRVGEDGLILLSISRDPARYEEGFSLATGKIKLASAEGYIEHSGTIVNPGGEVTFNAPTDVGRITLSPESTIDVSGNWVNYSSDHLTFEVNMDSNVLKNEYEHKDGLLFGETVTVSRLTGSAIGDVSASLWNPKVSASEHPDSVRGGAITLTAREVIAKTSSVLDISGGGYEYSAGALEQTYLLWGNRIISIEEAPHWLPYAGIVGPHIETHGRFGVQEVWRGLHAGSPLPLVNQSTGFKEGHDAGKLWIQARSLVLDGSILAGVHKSRYQTEAYDDDQDETGTRGLTEPKGGTIILGKESLAEFADRLTGDVKVAKEVAPLPTDFDPDPVASPLLAERDASIVPADAISKSGAGAFEIHSNRSVTIEKGASIMLSPAGRTVNNERRGGLKITAESIKNEGEITVPGGSVLFTLEDGAPGFALDADSPRRIFLDSGSSISVAGMKYDNTDRTDSLPIRHNHLDGGLVDFITKNQINPKEGIIIKFGAKIDVSGGYEIDPSGKAYGGDGGSISLEGPFVIIDGELEGMSLAGNSGGALSVHSYDIRIQPEHEKSLPSDFAMDDSLDPAQTTTIFGADYIKDRGFSELSLTAEEVDIESGVTLRPSYLKERPPMIDNINGREVAGGFQDISSVTGRIVSNRDKLVHVDPDYLGKSSISIIEGPEPSDRNVALRVPTGLTLPEDFRIEMSPDAESSAAIKTSGRLVVNGVINVPGGKINLASTLGERQDPGIEESIARVIIKENTRLLANGRTIPDLEPTFASVEEGTWIGSEAIGGGTVDIAAVKDIVIEDGVEINISGTADGVRHYKNLKDEIISVPQYAGPGTLSLGHGSGLDISEDAQILVENSGGKELWGGLVLSQSEAETTDMIVDPALLQAFLNNNFQDLTLKTTNSLVFEENLDLDLKGKLVLDSGGIKAGGPDVQVNMDSSWLYLTDSAMKEGMTDISDLESEQFSDGRLNKLAFNADWIDLMGEVTVQGFAEVVLNAGKEITGQDKPFFTGVSTENVGMLAVDGNLNLEAPRIYPKMNIDDNRPSHYSFVAIEDVSIGYGEAGPGDLDAPIYSAMGKLTIQGKNIEHGGFLAAPLGTVELKAIPECDGVCDEFNYEGGKIVLKEGGLIRVGGYQDLPIAFGSLSGQNWEVENRDDPNKNDIIFDGLIKKQVLLSGSEVIGNKGAVIEGKGGGSVFAYEFLNSIEGSENPLARSGSYVILPKGQIDRPGKLIYLDGNEELGLEPGYYNILDQSYAFAEGALIVRNLESAGEEYIPGMTKSLAGHDVVTGYLTARGVGGAKEKGGSTGYTVRRASEVMREGRFNIATKLSGDGGDLSVAAFSGIVGNDFDFTRVKGEQLGIAMASDEYISASGRVLDESMVNFQFEDSIEYSYGTLAFAAKEIEITESDTGLEQGKLVLNAKTLSTAGQDIVAGNTEDDLNESPPIITYRNTSLQQDDLPKLAVVTDSVEIMDNAELYGSNLTLQAQNDVVLGGDSFLRAKDPQGHGAINITAGTLTRKSGSTLHAADDVVLEISDMDYQPGGEFVKLDHSTLTLKGKKVAFTSDESTVVEAGILKVDPGLLGIFESIDDLKIASRTDMYFYGDIDVSVEDKLTLSAESYLKSDLNGDVNISATEFTIQGGLGADYVLGAGTGDFSANADLITVGDGYVVFDNFTNVSLTSSSDILFSGRGELNVDGGLQMTAPRIAGAALVKNDYYFAPDFAINAQGGIDIRGGGGTAGTSITPAARLKMTADSITLQNKAHIDAFSGLVSLVAANDLIIGGNSRITAQGAGLVREVFGYKYLDVHSGGIIELKSEQGKVEVDSGSVLDVSNSFNLADADIHKGDRDVLAESALLDAGLLSISSPTEDAVIAGDLKGSANSAQGKGGSFVFDSKSLGGGQSGSLSDKLQAGGFDGDLAFRLREGNVEINKDVSAESFILSADTGAITLNSAITRAGSDGGYVEINSGSDLTLAATSLIDVSGASGEGGTVRLSASKSGSSESGVLSIDAGSRIVAAGAGSETDPREARVWLRAERDRNDVKMNVGGGAIENAGEVIVEAYRVYTGGSWSGSWDNHAENYIDDTTLVAADLKNNLNLTDGTEFYFLPGVEVRANAGFNYNQNKDISGWRYGDDDVPGVLTIRAKNGINFQNDKKLYDNPNKSAHMAYDGLDSWAFNFIAGADFNAANIMTVDPTSAANADITVGDKSMVYTESAPIRMASAGDIKIGEAERSSDFPSGKYLNFNIATLDGKIEINAGKNLELDGGVIQTADSNIDVEAGEDVILVFGGVTRSAIRITGIAPEPSEVIPPITWGNLPADVQAEVEGILNPARTNWQEFMELWVQKSNEIKVSNGEPVSVLAPIDELSTAVKNEMQLWVMFAAYDVAMDPWLANSNMDTTGQYHKYAGRGDINIKARGSVNSNQFRHAVQEWDKIYQQGDNKLLLADYGSQAGNFGAAGFASMHDGDVSIVAGGNFFGPAAAFNAGDVRILADGNVDGRFRVNDGELELAAGGNVGMGYIVKPDGSIDMDGDSYRRIMDDQVIELTDARAMVGAQGGIEIGSVVNPGLSRSALAVDETSKKRALDYQYEHAGEKNTRINMHAVNGDFSISGDTGFYSGTYESKFEAILPPEVTIIAGGDLNLTPKNFRLSTAPSYTGNLELLSGKNISGVVGDNYSTVTMSEADPLKTYGVTVESEPSWKLSGQLINSLHKQDKLPVIIAAARDIKGINLNLRKKAEISSGRDISDFRFHLQNLSASDVTYVKAGNDIRFDTGSIVTERHIGIRIAGPGSLFVHAGNDIDLGATYSNFKGGISSVGNFYSPTQLPREGSDVYLIAGYYDQDKWYSAAEIKGFFNAIRTAGIEFTNYMNMGDTTAASAVAGDLRNKLYPEFFGSQTLGDGNIEMISSSINSVSGAADVNIINRGDLNVGQDIERESDAVQSNGIFTAEGGAVNIFTIGNVNVFESRIMTYRGGDITIWSDEGDIYAGRGSKAAINTQPPKLDCDVNGENCKVVFSPPAAGSGVRALTYDPDGATGPKSAPPIGDLFITAPEGVIDAGEAGIAGGNLFLGAQQILNTQNISFSGAAIGVSTGEVAAGNVGALSGAGDVTSGDGLSQQSQALDSAKKRAQSMRDTLAQDFTPNWVRVEFMGFIRN